MEINHKDTKHTKQINNWKVSVLNFCSLSLRDFVVNFFPFAQEAIQRV